MLKASSQATCMDRAPLVVSASQVAAMHALVVMVQKQVARLTFRSRIMS